MITKTKISPFTTARPRDLVGASRMDGIACAAADISIDGTSVSIGGLGVRPTYVPTLQAFHVGDPAWSPPV
jgi:hypothetical protein